ncbi:short-chain dehydrogenase [Rummeliibacillus suwonensis]|jgi:hypothetical protein|uniref:short-chain dehydrogenase n=1 Tax=Rummeliibacillus suwonensis TaxID=1306154 RepID=UPI0011B6FB16|nr:short-chain dehydrogenase [Rummeliibacillus suwonensis]MBO2534388.1 short-chain dehydrogenase [Rummeliibacillus suwonensis]
MGIWTWPLIFVVILISAVSFIWTLRIAKKQEAQNGSYDESYSKTVENNPTMLNPIIWCYIISGIFMGIVIIYYIVLYK